MYVISAPLVPNVENNKSLCYVCNPSIPLLAIEFQDRVVLYFGLFQSVFLAFVLVFNFFSQYLGNPSNVVKLFLKKIKSEFKEFIIDLFSNVFYRLLLCSNI